MSTASTCELPGGHISMEDAMRKAALQMMDYLQESVAKLSAAYLTPPGYQPDISVIY